MRHQALVAMVAVKYVGGVGAFGDGVVKVAKLTRSRASDAPVCRGARAHTHPPENPSSKTGPPPTANMMEPAYNHRISSQPRIGVRDSRQDGT
jgi:hypothetical protein